MTSPKYNKERNIEIGQMTIFRLTSGCCESIDELTRDGLDGKTALIQRRNCLSGLVEHFPLMLRGNRQFLARNFNRTTHFTFTAIRQPMEQFVSYHNMMYKMR